MPTTNCKDDILNDLIDGIAGLTTSERWQEWLDVQSRFHRYSFNNTLLIQLQCHEATRIAGFHAWRKIGRNVRKGEKAIWILAPVTRKLDSDSDDSAGSSDDAQPKSRALVAFKPAAVFDISQTDGEELPEIVSRLHGDDIGGAYENCARWRTASATRSRRTTSAARTASASSRSAASASRHATTRSSRSRRSHTSWRTPCSTRTSTTGRSLNSKPSPSPTWSAPGWGSTPSSTPSATSQAGPVAVKKPSPESGPLVLESSAQARDILTRRDDQTIEVEEQVDAVA